MRLRFLAPVAHLLVAGLVLLTGCESGGKRNGDPKRGPDDDVVATPERLRYRAENFWLARVAEDWASEFMFQEPLVRQNATVEEYVEWCETKGPFRYLRCELLDVAVENGFGWVHLDVTSAAVLRAGDLRSYAPERQVTRWERWAFIEGDWYPVPPQFLDRYSAAPAERDLAAEKRMRRRSDEFWALRQRGDLEAMYAMTDPRDREAVSLERFRGLEGNDTWVSRKVEWSEVLMGQSEGAMSVLYQRRPSDPLLADLPPEEIRLRDFWVEREGEWYVDLIRG